MRSPVYLFDLQVDLIIHKLIAYIVLEVEFVSVRLHIDSFDSIQQHFRLEIADLKYSNQITWISLANLAIIFFTSSLFTSKNSICYDTNAI